MICRVLCGPSCKKFQYKFSASNNTFCKATAQPMLVCAQPMLVRASLLAIVTGRLARASIVCELFTFALSINRSSHFIYNIYFSCWTTITRGSRYHMSSHGYPGQACYHRPENCRMLSVIPCYSERAKGVPFVSGIFLRRPRGSFGPPKLPKFSTMGSVGEYGRHNATTWSVRSRSTRAENAHSAQGCAFWGFEPSSLQFWQSNSTKLKFWVVDFQA